MVSIPSSRVGTMTRERTEAALEASFHPLKSGRNHGRQKKPHNFEQVSIPSSRVGTLHLRIRRERKRRVSIPSSRVGTPTRCALPSPTTEFPSPQVGSEPCVALPHATLGRVSIPSSRVGTHGDPAKREGSPTFPSPQVGSELLSLSFFYFHPLFPSPQVGSELRLSTRRRFANHVSIPSSRVGTPSISIVCVSFTGFHPLKSGRNPRSRG